jgi:hypothetical protein
MTGVPWKVEKVQPAKKINQGEVSSSSSYDATLEAPDPLSEKDLGHYDDDFASSYLPVKSAVKPHEDKKVSSYKSEPIQAESFSDSKRPLYDDDDDDQPRYKMKSEDLPCEF